MVNALPGERAPETRNGPLTRCNGDVAPACRVVTKNCRQRETKRQTAFIVSRAQVVQSNRATHAITVWNAVH